MISDEIGLDYMKSGVSRSRYYRYYHLRGASRRLKSVVIQGCGGGRRYPAGAPLFVSLFVGLFVGCLCHQAAYLHHDWRLGKVVERVVSKVQGGKGWGDGRERRSEREGRRA